MFDFIQFNDSLEEDFCLHYPLGSYVKLSPPLAAILDDGSATKYRHLVSIS